MRLTTHSHHTRYEENGSEGKFSLRMPRRQSSIFKPPVLIQFQVAADNIWALCFTVHLVAPPVIAAPPPAPVPPRPGAARRSSPSIGTSQSPSPTRHGLARAGRLWHTACRGLGGSGPG